MRDEGIYIRRDGHTYIRVDSFALARNIQDLTLLIATAEEKIATLLKEARDSRLSPEAIENRMDPINDLELAVDYAKVYLDCLRNIPKGT